MEASIHINRSEDGSTRLILQGPLEQEFAGNLIPLASKIEPPVTLDLKRVPYITATGSYALLSFYRAHGTKPFIESPNTETLKLLELSGAIRYVTLRSSGEAS